MSRVNDDLRSLVRHVGRMLLVSGLVTAVVAIAVLVAGREDLGEHRYVDAGIVLVVLAALQVFFWFALVYWVDTRESTSRDA